MNGAGIVLRSKTPDGVIQEIRALLCAYYAGRELVSAPPQWLARTRCEAVSSTPRT
jgi:hypothetical protein